MFPIRRQDILARLAADNPWWRSAPDPGQPPFSWPRRAFYSGFTSLVHGPVRRAVVLLGARRVGKTTLLHQFIGECARAAAYPAILFAALDTPTYTGLSLDDLLALFAEAHPHDITGPRLVIFDEIQYLRDWERHLKVLVDRYPRTRFVVSGSAGAALKRASTESGAGRFTDFLLPPLTFQEYLAFQGQSPVEVDDSAPHPVFRCRDIDALAAAFLDYLDYGGYPEAIFSPELKKRFRQFVGRDIVDKVLLRDLPVLYGITDIAELNRLFTVLAYNTGQEIGIDDLSRNANVAKPTIRRYLEYLEAAFLIYRLRRVDENARRFVRERGFKIHLVNPSMRAALFGPATADGRQLGPVVESAVLAQILHLPDRRQIHYARWKKGEIDVVAVSPATQRPQWALEIKWSDRIVDHAEDLGALTSFMTRHPGLAVAVTTRTRRDDHGLAAGSGRNVRFVPAPLYAYAAGYLSAREDGADYLLATGGLACGFVTG